MKKPYHRLKALMELPVVKICEIFSIPRRTVSKLDASQGGLELETMTEWLVDAVELLSERDRKKLLDALKPMEFLHGPRGATCVVLMNALWLMPKSEAVKFIKKVTEGK